MKERGMTSDIVTALFSVFSSIVLIILIVLYAVYSSLFYVVDSGGINAIVKTVGYSNFSEGNNEVKKSLKAYGVDDNTIDDFLSSNAAKEVYVLYSEDVLAAFRGEMDSKPRFTTENVQAAMVKNLDELVEIIVDEDATEQEALLAESRIVAAIKKTTDKLVKSIPSREKIAEGIAKAGMTDFLGFISNPSLKGFLIAIIIALCIALLILRYYKLGGFIWIGVDFCVAAVLALVVGLLAMFGVYSYMFASEITVTIESLERVFALQMFLRVFVIIVLAIIAFLGFKFIKKFISKHKKTALSE